MSDYTLYNADCLDILPTLEPQSVDAVIADIPSGRTACAWDGVIPFDPMWSGIKRALRPRGACVLLGCTQPFTSALVMSNVEMFKWEDIWHKTKATGHLNAKLMPLREHESVLVFGVGRVTFNPQITKKAPANVRPATRGSNTNCYRAFDIAAGRTIPIEMTYPRSIIRFPHTSTSKHGLHPTQKPLALLEYLVNTYTNEGDCVLDFTMGSGTTGHACGNLGRRFVGIEQDAGYFAIAQERIATAYAPLRHMQVAV